ncbi:polysaccharide biosynthesis tyrosine autokinase [Cognatishimia sp. F0-27]|uniref:GumC family protein n=1 Tax=Cognatishimia sp. F0-27 TaxID=2816855 RepID=UPI001D0CD390|nr:polysaccharide biosynthesis tyrosine autokinase [Cognatishimia sp. F0-27]MCC1494759.1 polysaccharide biosynthesis tyrosine autokinase [Cognatishimia sp. F0-27]
MQMNTPSKPDTAGTGPAVQEIDLSSVLRALWASKFFIAGVAFMTMMIFGYYAFAVAEDRYAATTDLVLEARDNLVVDIESVLSGNSLDDQAINTELEIITSRKTISDLVDRLDLMSDPEFNGSLREPPRFSVGIAVNAIAQMVRRVIPRSEEAPQAAEESGGSELSEEDRIRFGVESRVGASIRASAKFDTYILQITATTASREKSALLANTLAEVYLENQINTKFEATQYAVEWLSDRVSELEIELRERESALRDLRAQSTLISSETLEGMGIRAKDMRDRLLNEEENRDRLQAALDSLRTTATGTPEEIVLALDDPILNRLMNDIRNGSTSARTAFDARVARLLAERESALNRSEAQRAALQTSYDRLLEETRQQSEDLIRIEQEEREVLALQVLYDTFLARLKETTIQIGLQSADSRVLSEAIPGYPVAPRRMMLLFMGVVLGTILGTAIVLLRELTNTRFRTVEELEHQVGVGVLAQVPRMEIRKRDQLLDYLRNQPTSPAVESLRNLRTSILMSNVDNPPKVILFTSSLPGEGKTTLSIGLSQNLAAIERRVLLIDCDTRRKSLNFYFDINPKGGITTVLAGQTTLEEAITPVKDGFDILMAGETGGNSVDLFSSNGFKALMEQARETYDMIILDTPPVRVVPDARVLGAVADAIVYCVLWDNTPKAVVQEGLREFASVGRPVTGLVLSQVNIRRMQKYGYGGYNYYGYKSYT